MSDVDDNLDDDVGLDGETADAVAGVADVTREEVYINIEKLVSFADRQALRVIKEMQTESAQAVSNKRSMRRRDKKEARSPADVFQAKLQAFINKRPNTMADLLVGMRLVARATAEPSQRDEAVKVYLRSQLDAIYSLTDDYKNNFLQVLAYVGDLKHISLCLDVIKEGLKDDSQGMPAAMAEVDEAPDGEARIDQVVNYLLLKNYFGDSMSATAEFRRNHQIAQVLNDTVESISPGNQAAQQQHVDNILPKQPGGRLNFDYVNRNRRYIDTGVAVSLARDHGHDILREDLRYNKGALTRTFLDRAIQGDSSCFDLFFPDPSETLEAVGAVNEDGHDLVDELLINSNEDCYARLEPLFMKYGEVVFGEEPPVNRSSRIRPGTKMAAALSDYIRDTEDATGKTKLHLAVENYDDATSDTLIITDLKRWILDDLSAIREQIGRIEGGARIKKAAELQRSELINADRLDRRDSEGQNVFHSAMVRNKIEPLKLLFGGLSPDQVFRVLSKMVEAEVPNNDGGTDRKRMLFYGFARILEDRGSRGARYVMKVAVESKFEQKFKEMMQRQKERQRAQAR